MHTGNCKKVGSDNPLRYKPVEQETLSFAELGLPSRAVLPALTGGDMAIRPD